MYTIEQIEDAYIEKLEPLKATHSVRVIKTYQGELDNEEEIRKAVKLFPSIFVVYGGSRYEKHGSRKIEYMRYSFFVCDKNLRTENEARRGGAGNPGTYSLLNGMRDLLFGSRLGLEIYPNHLKLEQAIWSGKGVSVYAAEYETAQALLYTGD